jgi:AraC-like DNA-binding protein
MDLLFDLVESSPRVVSVIGPMTRAQRHLSLGAMSFLGVRFRPGGFTPLLDVSGSEIRDDAIPAASGGLGWADELAEHLGGAGPGARPEMIWAVLRARYAGARAPDSTVLEADRLVRASHGRLGVRELAAAVQLSPRGLQRRYAEHAGLAPKTALRIERFRHAAHLLTADPDLALSSLAYRCGYHDQAHLGRDFRSLSGLTPGAWRAQGGAVAFVQDAVHLAT